MKIQIIFCLILGDLVIWDARIWHNKKNNTNNTRWALVATL